MRPIEWLLGHFDEPDVTEIVLGLDRPAAVKAGEGYRAITSMAFGRGEIETLVADTPLPAGTINAEDGLEKALDKDAFSKLPAIASRLPRE